MANEITVPNTANLTPAQRRDLIKAKVQDRKAAGEVPTPSHANGAFADLDGNTGKFTAGRDGATIGIDDKFVVVLDNCTYERPFWLSGRVQKRLTVNVLDGGMPDTPPNEPKVGDLPKPRERDGWGEVINLAMAGVDGGKFEGVTVTLGAGNMSQRDAVSGLLSQAFDQIETEDGQRGLFFPIITIEIDSYYNKTYSRDVFFPVFHIHEWTNVDGSERISAWVGDGDDVLG